MARPDVKAMSKAAERYREALTDPLRTVASARREGVIEGLKMALHLRQYGVIEADHIRAELKRLRAGS